MIGVLAVLAGIVGAAVLFMGGSGEGDDLAQLQNRPRPTPQATAQAGDTAGGGGVAPEPAPAIDPDGLVEMHRDAIVHLISAEGTGFVFDDKGSILTETSFVGEADTLLVILNDGTELVGTITGRNTYLGLAIVTADLPLIPTRLPWAPSDDLEPGTELAAVGYSSLSDVVSLEGIKVTLTEFAYLDGKSIMLLDGHLEPGLQGGPVLDQYGFVVGVAMPPQQELYSAPADDIGLAQPSSLVLALMPAVNRATYEPLPTPTPTPDAVPTAQPAPTATPFPPPTFEPTPTAEPAMSNSAGTATPTPTPAPGSTGTPAPTVTPQPTATAAPTPTPTSAPGSTATPAPTATPQPTATPSGATLAIDDDSLAVGQTTLVRITLPNAPTGVAGFVVQISVANPSVAEIAAVNFPNYGLSLNEPVTFPTGSVRSMAVDLQQIIRPGETDFELITVEVRGTGAGSTAITASFDSIDDDNGNALGTVIAPASVSVSVS